MFENIIGHKQITSQLKYEVKNHKLPSSVLIEGPVYSGKLTIALELARAVSCHNDGSWNCSCTSCRLQKLLINPDTLLIGWDNFLEEIIFSKNILAEKDELFSRYLFIRSVRKLMRRFDPVFYDDKDTKLKKIQPSLTSLEEKLTAFDPSKSLAENKIKEKDLDEIIKSCSAVVKEVAAVPVNQLRRITFWNHTTTSDSKKIVIVENCERMNDSARNSMLKILEEPPENSYFIFLSSRAGEIIPTIRSRLRTYTLKERTPGENGEVIKRIFRDNNSSFSSLSDYFSSFDPMIEEIKTAAKNYMIYFFSGEKDSDAKEQLKAMMKNIKENSLRTFFENILLRSEEILKNKEFMKADQRNLLRLEALNEFIRRNWKNYDTLNISCDLILENLLFFGEKS